VAHQTEVGGNGIVGSGTLHPGLGKKMKSAMSVTGKLSASSFKKHGICGSFEWAVFNPSGL
jgi:hypothetical protein